MKIKTADLQGAALDWAVAKSEADELAALNIQHPQHAMFYPKVSPSTNWAQGGPIIEREQMGIEPMTKDDCDGWLATCCSTAGVHMEFGPTPLIAAMRCYVASKLGDVVEVPEELV